MCIVCVSVCESVCVGCVRALCVRVWVGCVRVWVCVRVYDTLDPLGGGTVCGNMPSTQSHIRMIGVIRVIRVIIVDTISY